MFNDRSDGIGIKNLINKNIPIYIVSSEKNPVVKHRADKLVYHVFNL